MLILVAKLHSKGFHDINAVVSLPLSCFALIKCKQSDCITKTKTVGKEKKGAVEHKLMVLSSQNALKVFRAHKKAESKKISFFSCTPQ